MCMWECARHVISRLEGLLRARDVEPPLPPPAVAPPNELFEEQPDAEDYLPEPPPLEPLDEERAGT